MPKSDAFVAKLSPEVRRLFAIAALVGETPGIMFAQLKEALELELGLERPLGTSTLHQDIKRLKHLRVLPEDRHREGYFPTVFAFDPDEREALLVALRIAAEDLRNPHAHALLERLTRRLGEDLVYPIEAVGHRVVVETMEGPRVPFIAALRKAIRGGYKVAIAEKRNPYHMMGTGAAAAGYPLQLVFHGAAWYLLFDDPADERQRFRAYRLDRLVETCEVVERVPRGVKAQRAALAQAKALMALAWDVAVPASADALEPVTVWFAPQAERLLAEIERGLPNFTLRPAREGVHATFRLPVQDDVRNEFLRWLATWGPLAEVLEPLELREAMRKRHRQALERYEREEPAGSGPG